MPNMNHGTGAALSGLYLNLDRATKRRAKLEYQLRDVGIAAAYERFCAIEGREAPSPLTAGEFGCLQSHICALGRARNFNAPTHILEDDTLVSRAFGPATVAPIRSGLLQQFDILFTDTFVHPNLDDIRRFMQISGEAMARGGAIRLAEFRAVDLAHRALACAGSYFVSPEAIARILACFEDEMRREPLLPVDLYYRKFADEGRLRVGCLVPFLTSSRLEDVVDTSIEGRVKQINNSTVQVLALLRYSFFVDRDLDGYAQPLLDSLRGPLTHAPDDAHRRIVGQILDYVLSNQYRRF
jgi:GR25 family glycosyltransferase involved in LPS biosynthesis